MVRIWSSPVPIPTDLSCHIEDSEPWFRARLRELVEHKTISPGLPSVDAIRAGAEAARAIIEGAGAQAELIETAGTPSVLGRFPHPAPKAKLVIYNHLDVQPADAEAWHQADPFGFVDEADEALGVVYRGRGTTDDKGPGLCAVRAAELARRYDLPIEVVVLWETEEEIGSPHFGDAVSARRSVLSGDAVVVSDTIWPSADQPAISIGLRGGMQAVLRLETGRKDVHSGLTGGGARNPLRELCAVSAEIERAAFWRAGANTPSADEIDGYLRSGFDLDYFRRAYDLNRLASDVPLEVMLGIWARPTYEVHGLAGGYTGPGVKTAIPPQAELKISFRLVPDQDPDAVADALSRFVAQINPDVEVDVLGRFAPYVGPTAGPVHDAIAHGMTEAFGRAPVLVREGGSIGAVPILARELGVPVHFLPLSLPEHGYHAPNECFDWRQAKGGIAAYVHAFAKLVE